MISNQAQTLINDTKNLRNNVTSIHNEIMNMYSYHSIRMKKEEENFKQNLSKIRNRNNDVLKTIKALRDDKASMTSKFIEYIVLKSRSLGFSQLYRVIYELHPTIRISRIIGKFRISKNDRRELHRIRYNYIREYLIANGENPDDEEFQTLS
jgi:hypothetical protein